MTDATNFLTQEYYDLQNSLYDINDEMWAAEQSAKNYQKAIVEDQEALAAAEAVITEAVFRLTVTSHLASSPVPFTLAVMVALPSFRA